MAKKLSRRLPPIRLYEEDAQLLQLLKEAEADWHGDKSTLYKVLLRQGLETSPQQSGNSFDAQELRRILEATIRSELASLSLATAPTSPASEETDEAAQMLANLEASMEEF